MSHCIFDKSSRQRLLEAGAELLSRREAMAGIVTKAALQIGCSPEAATRFFECDSDLVHAIYARIIYELEERIDELASGSYSTRFACWMKEKFAVASPYRSALASIALAALDDANNLGVWNTQTDSIRNRNLAMLAQVWHDPIPALTEILQPEMILRIPIFDRTPSKKWGTQRMTLLGDSAHATTPTLGHGACLAIESAYILASALTQPGTPEIALNRYSKNRKARTDKIIQTSYRLGGIIQTNSSLLATLRNLAVSYLPTAIHYRSLRNLVAPGCRVPVW